MNPMSKKKGGNVAVPVVPRQHQEIQSIVNKLVYENGSNLPHWFNYPDILLREGLTPVMVTPVILQKADGWCR